MTRRWHSDEKPIVTPGKGWALEFALTNDERSATSGIGFSSPEYHRSPSENAVPLEYSREKWIWSEYDSDGRRSPWLEPVYSRS